MSIPRSGFQLSMILPKSSANNNNKVMTIAPKLRRQLTIDRHFFKKNIKIQNPLVKTRHLQQDIPILLSSVTTVQKLTNMHWSWAIIVHHFQCKNSQKTLILSYHCSPFSGSGLQIHTQKICLCFFSSPLSLFTNSIEVHVHAEQNDTNCNFGPNISCCDSQINPNLQLTVQIMLNKRSTIITAGILYNFQP